MKLGTGRFAGLALEALLPLADAHAQLEGMLGKGGHGTDRKGMAGMASGPMTSGSMGNVAGLLQYCIGNNYLSGDNAGAVKDQLMGKLPGGASTQDRGYSDGLKGLLHGSSGNQMNLGGVSAEVTKKVCETVLHQARSFL